MGVPHLDSFEEYTAGLLRVCAHSADEHNSERTLSSTDAHLLEAIEQRIEVADRDLCILFFRDAHGRDAQSPNASVMLSKLLLQRRGIG
jgi:hypothetical protein